MRFSPTESNLPMIVPGRIKGRTPAFSGSRPLAASPFLEDQRGHALRRELGERRLTGFTQLGRVNRHRHQRPKSRRLGTFLTAVIYEMIIR
jgi:hypothetical protein